MIQQLEEQLNTLIEQGNNRHYSISSTGATGYQSVSNPQPRAHLALCDCMTTCTVYLMFCFE